MTDTKVIEVSVRLLEDLAEFVEEDCSYDHFFLPQLT